MLSASRRRVILVLASAWLLSIAICVNWWIQSVDAASTLALLFNSAVLGFDAIILPLWVFFFAWRMRRPIERRDRDLPSAAMVVTKAPSEEWPIVRKTLKAMLTQDYPDEYDVWLADEDPDQATETWCEANGVGITTRRGIAAYHRDSWPRRTKCKEGNLAYFYDTVGYDNYEVVSQLDADHVPEPDYLWQMVMPFADPGIGYVAAPSICDSNAERSWSARGRLYAEAMLHGAIQAGCNGGWAPSCIGSHYAVRTSALKEIGGLGPELAEDFSTTLAMSAAGWNGTFAIDAEAHGEGPESVADCVTQDFQWARSMMAVALTVAPAQLRACSWKARLRLTSCLIWYPLFAVVMLASFSLPVIALLTGVALVQVPLSAFYLHILLPMLFLVGLAYWLRHCGALRPANAKVISWELVLFQLIRWPWALLGCLQAVAGRITGRQFGFKVTPKGPVGEAPLPLRVIFPYLLISAISGLCAILVSNPGSAGGYYFLALVNTFLYLGVAVAIIGLHLHEQSRALHRIKGLIRAAMPRVAAVAIVGVVSVTAAAARGDSVVRTIDYTGSSKPLAPAPSLYPLKTDPRAEVALGVTTNSGARSVQTPWQPVQLDQVNSFERAVKAHAGITMWFSDWATGKVDQKQLSEVSDRGSVPEITWEPWNHLLGGPNAQPEYSMKSIAAGKHDDYVRQWATGLADYGKPVLLRFAQEMNVPGAEYPWSQPANDSPAEYVAAWRHIHRIFTNAGANNVRWVFSPLSSYRSAENYYPGNRYVDVIGLSGFNGGSELDWGGWRSFNQIFGKGLRQAKQFAPGKPVQISEVSTARGSGSKAAWVKSMFQSINRHPEIRSVIWFNVPKQANWKIQSSPGAERAFAKAVQNPRYGGRP